MLNLFQSLFLL